MINFPKQLESVVDHLSRLPGVGGKTALRQALIMSNWQEEDLLSFGKSLASLSKMDRCEHCGVFCDEKICNICSNENRKEKKQLCIVENFSDYLAIEKSEHYRGLYYILGGVLNPLMGIGPEELNIGKLISRINRDSFVEIILAINPSVEGDATCSYIKQKISSEIKIERIGFGMPIGGSLEYLDPLTISKALENRRSL